MRRFICATILATAVGAVASVAPPTVRAQEPSSVNVIVDNQAFPDVHVYVLDGGTRRSLGLVTGLTRRTFTLPEIVVGSHRGLRILADPIAARGGYLSPALIVDRGDWVTVTIRSNLNLSTSTIGRPFVDEQPSESPSDSASESAG